VVAQLRHCFSGDKSFAPAGFLDSLEKFTSDKGKAEKHMKRLGCIDFQPIFQLRDVVSVSQQAKSDL